VEDGVKSKRIMAEEEDAPRPAEEDEAAEDDAVDDGGAKRQSRAAFRAAAAKNWLGAGLASSAEETEPSGLICTRTLTRTVPRMLERALEEMSGTTLWTMVGVAGFAFAVGASEETEPEPEPFSGDADVLPVREGWLAEAAPEFGLDAADVAGGVMGAALDLLLRAEFDEAELEFGDGVSVAMPPEFSGDEFTVEPVGPDAVEFGVARLLERRK
jgi:hypothetical protein